MRGSTTPKRFLRLPIPGAFLAADLALAIGLSNCCMVGSECARGGATVAITNDTAEEITVFVEFPEVEFRFGIARPGETIADGSSPNQETGCIEYPIRVDSSDGSSFTRTEPLCEDESPWHVTESDFESP